MNRDTYNTDPSTPPRRSPLNRFKHTRVASTSSLSSSLKSHSRTEKLNFEDQLSVHDSPIFSLIDSIEDTFPTSFASSSRTKNDHRNQITRRRSASLDSMEYFTMKASNLTLKDENVHNLSVEATRSLWIGNLDPTLSESDVRPVFEPFGKIESLKLLPTKECAFVNYESVSSARSAKESLQGTALGNMIMRIGYGKSSDQLQRVYSTDSSTASRALWIGNLGNSISSDELYAIFSKFGKIESCRILEGKSCGFVNFYEIDNAAVAKKQLSGTCVGGSFIKIGFARTNMKKLEQGHSRNSSSDFEHEFPPLRSNTPLNLKGQEEKSFCAKCSVRISEVVVFPCRHDMCHECSLKLQRNGKIVVDEETICLICQNAITNIFNTFENSFGKCIIYLLDDYLGEIPQLPTDYPIFPLIKLREFKRRLDSPISVKEAESIFHELLPFCIELSFDHVGNTVIQKMIEKCNDYMKLKIIQILSPYIASLGIHKNGTWVIQKLIDFARTKEQQGCITSSIKPYLVALLHDQFGNYVVQCCLVLGSRNQFIFDGFCFRIMEIATSRFGSRAMKSCLDSEYTSVLQKRQVALQIIKQALPLVHDQNGVILIQWLLDSDIPGKFYSLAKQLANHFSALSLHKFGSAVVAKLIQKTEVAAADLVTFELFQESILPSLLQDPVSTSILHKCMITCANQRPLMVSRLKPLLEMIPQNQRGIHHSRLHEELNRASSYDSERLFHPQLDFPRHADSLSRSFDRALFDNSRPLFESSKSSALFEHVEQHPLFEERTRPFTLSSTLNSSSSPPIAIRRPDLSRKQFSDHSFMFSPSSPVKKDIWTPDSSPKSFSKFL